MLSQAGYTPLHTACHFGQINMIEFLLRHGAAVNPKTKVCLLFHTTWRYMCSLTVFCHVLRASVVIVLILVLSAKYINLLSQKSK